MRAHNTTLEVPYEASRLFPSVLSFSISELTFMTELAIMEARPNPHNPLHRLRLRPSPRTYHGSEYFNTVTVVFLRTTTNLYPGSSFDRLLPVRCWNRSILLRSLRPRLGQTPPLHPRVHNPHFLLRLGRCVREKLPQHVMGAYLPRHRRSSLRNPSECNSRGPIFRASERKTYGYY